MSNSAWYLVRDPDNPGTLILTDVPADEYLRRSRNYRPLLDAHYRDRGKLEPGVYATRVDHDYDCGFFRDAPCDCSPTISSGPPIGNRAARRRAARERGRR